MTRKLLFDVRAALPGNVLNEWLGPRVNVGIAGVFGTVCFVICAFSPNFPIYFASYMLCQGASLLAFAVVSSLPLSHRLTRTRPSLSSPVALTLDYVI